MRDWYTFFSLAIFLETVCDEIFAFSAMLFSSSSESSSFIISVIGFSLEPDPELELELELDQELLLSPGISSLAPKPGLSAVCLGGRGVLLSRSSGLLGSTFWIFD